MELFPAHLADTSETNSKILPFFEALYRALFWALFPELGAALFSLCGLVESSKAAGGSALLCDTAASDSLAAVCFMVHEDRPRGRARCPTGSPQFGE